MSIKDELTSEVQKQLNRAAMEASSVPIQEELKRVVRSDEFKKRVKEYVQESTNKVKRQIANEPEKDLMYTTVFDFVTEFLSKVYAHSAERPNPAWSRRWYEHPHAMIRFNAMWSQFEESRLATDNDDVTLEKFLREVGDYHMQILMKKDGIFADCRFEETDDLALPSN